MLDWHTFEQPRLRVIAATPGLAPGGAEMWLGTLVRSAQTVRYTAIVGGSFMDAHLEPMFHGAPVRYATEPTTDAVAAKILECVKEFGADLIMYWGFAPMQALSQAGIPVLHVSHSSGIEKTDWHETAMPTYGDSRANFFAAVSSSAAEFFIKKIRRQEKVFVVHNGADVERTRPYLGGPAQREIWGIPTNRNVMLFLGRLSKEKCPEIVMDAMQHLDDSWWLVFYGWGNQEEQLLRSASSSSSAERVLFPQPRLSGLGDVYAAADVVVIPSMTEAFPMVLIEAWQAGKPVVCAEFSTLLEIERDYHQGHQLAHHVPCPPTPKQLAEAARSLVDIPASANTEQIEAYELMVDAARRLALYTFSATAMVGRWEELFYRCVAEWHRVGQTGQVKRVKVGQ